MASVEAAVAWAEAIARDDSHGYSQGARDGQDFDCSSLVCRSMRAAGFGTPSPSFSTRTMGQWLESHGWVWHGGLAGVARGDILWKVGHTGWALNGYRSVEARIDERGRITGGRPGDQTGGEIGFFDIASMPWLGYWRLNEEDEVTQDDINSIVNGVWLHVLPNGRHARDIVSDATSDIIRMHDDYLPRVLNQVERTDDPSGRNVALNDHDHIKWLAAKQASMDEKLDAIEAAVSKLADQLAAADK